jgi:hypothetical protein
MVSINFCPPYPLSLPSGIILDCKMFQQSMFGFPSDRHAYHLKCCIHPKRYCFFLFLFYKIIVSRLIYFMFRQGKLPYGEKKKLFAFTRARGLPSQVKNFVSYKWLAPSLLYTCNKNYHIFFSRHKKSTLLTSEPGAIGLCYHI